MGSHAVGYDEFALLHENASEAGLPFDKGNPPSVRRVYIDAPSGVVSALVWGTEPAEFVLLHGVAQNAHTWDTVALALRRPLVAIDLPGHGHSQWRSDADYRPETLANDLVTVIGALAPNATALVGMSLGGLTALALAASEPNLVRRVVLVDITPGVNAEKAADIVAFVGGPETFPNFDAIVEATMAFNPSRSRASLTRGVIHNAHQQADGTWTWNYHRPSRAGNADLGVADLWDAVSTIDHPMMLVQGGLSGVVDDDDIVELRRRQPAAKVVVIEDAGHSIQGDRPLVLAGILMDFVR